MSTRSLLLVVAAVLLTSTVFTRSARAQGEPPQLLLNSVVFAGGAVGDVCFDPVANLVYVIDVSNNDTIIYGPNLGFLGVLPSVFPAGTIATGIAAEALTGLVFWSVYDPANGSTNLWGSTGIANPPVFIATVATAAGSIPAGIDAPVGIPNTLIVNDFGLASTYAIDFTGVVTRPPFPNPFGVSLGVAHASGPFLTHSADTLAAGAPTHFRTVQGITGVALDAVGININVPGTITLGFDYGGLTPTGGNTMYVSEVNANIVAQVTAQRSFIRGDFNSDGAFNISDPVGLLNWLFVGGAPSTCADAGDANDDGAANTADGIYMLNALFAGGAPPFAPFPNCGYDPTPDGARCDIPWPICP